MSTDLKALKEAIKVVADAVIDTVNSGGATGAAKIMSYQNLVPDVLQLLPDIGLIPAEASALQPPDYAALVAELGTDLALPAGKVENIVAASLKLLSDIATYMVPDVEALVAAAK